MPKNKNKTHTNARKNRNLKNKKNKTKANTNARKNRNLKNTRKKRTRNTKKNTRGGANMNELMEELKQLTELRNRAYNIAGASGYNHKRNERIKVLRRKLGLPIGINLRGNRGHSPSSYTRTDDRTWTRNVRPTPKPQLPEQELIFLQGSVHNQVLNMNQKVKALTESKKQNKSPKPKMKLKNLGFGYIKKPGRQSPFPKISKYLSRHFKNPYQQYRIEGQRKSRGRKQAARDGEIIPETYTVRPRRYSENHGEGIQLGMPVRLREGILPSKIERIEELSKAAKSSGVSPSNTARKEREEMIKFMESKPSKQLLKQLLKKSNKTQRGSLFSNVQGPGFKRAVTETTL